MAEYGTTFPVTIPSLSEDANIVTAFEDYHDDIQSYLVAANTAIGLKQDTISGAASSITSTNLTASRAVTSDSSGKITVSIVTAAELSYLSGVTSGVQAQLNDKAPSVSPTFTGNVVLPATTSIGNISSTELSYLDNVTSSIQTQLNDKAPSASPTFSGTVVLPAATSIGDVSSTELSYLNNVTSAIQTQLDGKVEKTNGTVTTADTTLSVVRNIQLSTNEPTGGSDGDVWLQYTA